MADSDHRSETTLVGTEREQVEAFVHDNRLELVGLLDGLSEEQARRRVVASETTLLGLVKHGVFVEKVWFHVAIGGRTRAELGVPDTPHESFLLRPDDTVASVVEDYQRTVVEADAIAAAYDLDDHAVHNRRGPLTLRWIYVHLVEELARHCGHGDILRELILVEPATDAAAPPS